MASPDSDSRHAKGPAEGSSYPLRATTSFLNERLGLYLSAEQQRGFATGLLIGTALGAALLTWNLFGLIRRNM